MVSGPALVLVGAPAAGKTTVGRELAARSGQAFTDTDEVLAQRLGLSLPEAWASLPPERIAAEEADACLAALAPEGIVALGSAAVADAAVRAALAGRTVVWLRVSAAQASRRLGMAALGMDALVAMRTRLDGLLQERERWYEEVATHRLDTDRLGVNDVVDGVERVWTGG
mgnify:CR=1 FL=1